MENHIALVYENKSAWGGIAHTIVPEKDFRKHLDNKTIVGIVRLGMKNDYDIATTMMSVVDICAGKKLQHLSQQEIEEYLN